MPKPSFLLGITLLAFVAVGTVNAQNPDYILSITNVSGESGTTVDVNCLLDSSAGSDIEAWSWGVCHDSNLLTVNFAGNGVTTATVNNGGPPDVAMYELFSDNWYTTVVVCIGGCAVLPPGSGPLLPALALISSARPQGLRAPPPRLD